MALTSLGIGSGLDAESIVSKLVALERQPINKLKSEANQLQTKISAYGEVQSAVSALNDAALKLTRPDIWQSMSAKSSDSTAVNLVTSAGAAAGNYNVNVSTLAASQSVVSNKVFETATDLVGAGTLVIEIGAWSGDTFTAKTASPPPPLTIEATDSLEIVRDKINALGSGVSASIVNDANGARLVMTSKETGVANGFRIQVPDPANPGQFLTDGTGLSALAYDPKNGTQGTTRNQPPSDAVATINGIEVRSSSNTFTNVLSGISLTVGKATSGPVSVSVGQDTTGITTAITDFANAFTALNSLLRTNTKYDEGSKTGGTLQGDSMAVSVLNQFRSLFSSPSLGGSSFTTLSAIGLQSKSGGALSVDTTKLNDAMSNLSEVRKLFSNADSVDPSKNGFATQVSKLANDLLRSDGVFSTRTTGLSDSIKRNEKRQEEIDAKAALYEKRLRAQYTALDKAMAGLSTQGNYVSQMISGLNANSKS